MRTAYNEVQFLIDEDTKKFKGISLGFDYCCEHEIGISGLNRKFDCIQKAGFKKAQTCPFTIIKEDERYITYSTWERYVDREDNKFFEGINSMWDEDNIQLTFDKQIVSFEQIKEFEEMIISCNMCFGSYPSSFRNSFCLLKYSEIPKSYIKEIEDKAIKLKKAKEKFKDSKAMKNLLKARKEFKDNKDYDNDSSIARTPYDSIYLDVNNPDGSIWLNPEHQSYLNANWIKESDIFDWIKGKKGRIIKDEKKFAYLKWECAMEAWSIMYYKKFYSGLPSSRELTWEQGTGSVSGKLLPLLKGKITEEKKNQIFNMIDGLVKSEVFYYMSTYWLYQGFDGEYYPKEKDRFPKGKNNKPLLPYVNNLPEYNKKELEGFLYGIGIMGRAIGIFDSDGACNTPTIKSNWYWWKDILIKETEYQVWNILGLIPDEYK